MSNVRFESKKLFSQTETGDVIVIPDEEFHVLKDGTKVIYDGKIAYITGNDSETCECSYYEELNYYIKYCSKDETYKQVNDRIDANNENHYDDTALWYHISEYKPMDLSIREELYSKEVANQLKRTLMTTYSSLDIHLVGDEILCKWLLRPLCILYPNIVNTFIINNESYFRTYLSEFTDIDMFASKIIEEIGMVAPFNEGHPKEFFDFLSNYIKYISNNI